LGSFFVIELSLVRLTGFNFAQFCRDVIIPFPGADVKDGEVVGVLESYIIF
jgi:hypothetical protein